jgi:YfiH family protein
MELIVPDWLGENERFADRIGALTTLRGGGVSGAPYHGAHLADGGFNLGLHVGDAAQHVAENRRRLRSIVPAPPVWLAQVHGTDVQDAALAEPGAMVQADASFSTARNVVCAIQTADCLPVLFCDANARVVAAAHAGWRGLAYGVLAHTVARMRAAGAGEILAWLGPAIGPQCFEVGPDVVNAFDAFDADADAFSPLAGAPDKYLADMYWLARNALQRVGVTRVSGGDYCTVSDAQRFYSYRRDRVTGRIASLIWIK